MDTKKYEIYMVGGSTVVYNSLTSSDVEAIRNAINGGLQNNQLVRLTVNGKDVTINPNYVIVFTEV